MNDHHHHHCNEGIPKSVHTDNTTGVEPKTARKKPTTFTNNFAYIPHSLFLLADSALPLGSFAYSSGLESYIAHNKPLPAGTHPITSFHRFLSLSLSCLASTTLPYLLKAYRCPDELEVLDNDLDASTPCTVARRASLAQGLALLSVWERAFKESYACDKGEEEDGCMIADAAAAADGLDGENVGRAVVALDAFSEALKQAPSDGDEGGDVFAANGHFAPLWGVVCLAMGVDIEQAAYVFMLNHAKAVLSAAVRASVMGPYQAQALLASKALQEMITKLMRKDWSTEPEDAGQVVPTIDLWMGRHELLYSRIFNS